MRSLRAVLYAIVVLSSTSTRSEPLRLRSPSTIETEGGSRLSLPPGYFLTTDDWQKLDIEIRRLQKTETRKNAENASLKKHVQGGKTGAWWTLLGSFAAGAALGVYLTR